MIQERESDEAVSETKGRVLESTATKPNGACSACHNGAEEKLGNRLVTANPLELTSVAGKNGVIQLNLQVAYDNDNAYFRAQSILVLDGRQVISFPNTCSTRKVPRDREPR